MKNRSLLGMRQMSGAAARTGKGKKRENQEIYTYKNIICPLKICEQINYRRNVETIS